MIKLSTIGWPVAPSGPARSCRLPTLIGSSAPSADLRITGVAKVAVAVAAALLRNFRRLIAIFGALLRIVDIPIRCRSFEMEIFSFSRFFLQCGKLRGDRRHRLFAQLRVLRSER